MAAGPAIPLLQSTLPCSPGLVAAGYTDNCGKAASSTTNEVGRVEGIGGDRFGVVERSEKMGYIERIQLVVDCRPQP